MQAPALASSSAESVSSNGLGKAVDAVAVAAVKGWRWCQ